MDLKLTAYFSIAMLSVYLHYRIHEFINLTEERKCERCQHWFYPKLYYLCGWCMGHARGCQCKNLDCLKH